MACLPVQIAGRNRLWREMIMDAIRSDPDWEQGEYKTEPTDQLRSTPVQISFVARAAGVAARD
jgi:homoserine O-acetyltransferase